MELGAGARRRRRRCPVRRCTAYCILETCHWYVVCSPAPAPLGGGTGTARAAPVAPHLLKPFLVKQSKIDIGQNVCGHKRNRLPVLRRPPYLFPGRTDINRVYLAKLGRCTNDLLHQTRPCAAIKNVVENCPLEEVTCCRETGKNKDGDKLALIFGAEVRIISAANERGVT